VFVDEQFLHPDLGFSVRFPHGWKLINQSNQVVGLSPKRDGVVLLQLDSPGDDPEAAANAYAEREGLRLDGRASIRVGGLSAYRAEAVVPTSFGRTHAEITWIAYGGRVYRLLAGIEAGSLRKYQGLFRKFAHSFRPLTPEDRAQVTELRLRVVSALPGESIDALSQRVGNEWSSFYTAVANALPIGAPLAGGTLVKVAVREAYLGPRS
jgi:predicted Zn-dependent protease